MTPMIAVLTGHHPADRAAVHRTYLNAIWLAGGQPVVLSPPPPAAYDRAFELMDRCDAMIVTGGGDVDPPRYGEKPNVELMDVDASRDDFELAAIPHWLELGRPLLGICRGLQVLTVATGGKLYQDLPTAGFNNHWNAEQAHEPVHGIRATPGSLAELALNGREKVNSIHHQAVAVTGPGYVATAWSDDDVIEAVEKSDGSPVMGLQWHPERLACPPHPDDADLKHLAIFEWLVGAGATSRPSAFRNETPDAAGRPAACRSA